MHNIIQIWSSISGTYFQSPKYIQNLFLRCQWLQLCFFPNFNRHDSHMVSGWICLMSNFEQCTFTILLRFLNHIWKQKAFPKRSSTYLISWLFVCKPVCWCQTSFKNFRARHYKLPSRNVAIDLMTWGRRL